MQDSKALISFAPRWDSFMWPLPSCRMAEIRSALAEFYTEGMRPRSCNRAKMERGLAGLGTL